MSRASSLVQASTPFVFFFFNDTATTEIYTLSLHDALPISIAQPVPGRGGPPSAPLSSPPADENGIRDREEHTSELQSRPHLVCRLLLEKKKQRTETRSVNDKELIGTNDSGAPTLS